MTVRQTTCSRCMGSGRFLMRPCEECKGTGMFAWNTRSGKLHKPTVPARWRVKPTGQHADPRSDK